MTAIAAAAIAAALSVLGTVRARASGPTATSVQLVSPSAAVPTADGGFLLTDEQKCTVSKVDSSGGITGVAGSSGSCGEAGDGGAATSAQLNYPTDAVPTSDGGFLIAEGGAPSSPPFPPGPFPVGSGLVRKVSAGGTISTVAGTTFSGVENQGDTGDGGPATSAAISALTVVPYNPPGAAVSTPGSGFLVTDLLDCVVRKVSGTGTISTVAGNGACGVPSPAFGAESCPTTSLCVAAGGGVGSPTGSAVASENAVLTGDPSSGATSAWTIKGNIDPWTTSEVFTNGTSGSSPVNPPSCAPGAGLCVTTDNYGNVTTTTDASDAGAAVWKTQNVAPSNSGLGPGPLLAVSCPSSTQCVANDSAGGVWTSTDAASTPSATWTNTASVDPASLATGISCPETTFCVLIDSTGNVTTLSSLSSGVWGTTSGQTLSGGPDLQAISCAPGTTFCAVGDLNGDIWTSTNASSGSSATWHHSASVDSGNSITSISCPTSSFCDATDAAANSTERNVVRSTNANNATPTWTTQTGVDGGNSVNSISCASATVCVVGTENSGYLLVSDNASNATPTWGQDTLSNGDGGPATSAILDNPVSAVPTADGGFLVTQFAHTAGLTGTIVGSCAVRKVSSTGTITTVAGSLEATTSSGTTCGFGGDNASADSAQLNEPATAVPTPGGGFMVADYGNNRVRQITDQTGAGAISTIAGNGSSGGGGDGGPATSASVPNPSSAVPLAGGGFLIGSFSSDANNSARVREVSPNGTITTVAGLNGSGGIGGTGGGGGTGGKAPSCTVKPGGGKVLLKKPKRKGKQGKPAKVGVLTVKVTCDQAASIKLSTTITEQVSKHKRKHFSRSQSATVKAGVAATLTVKLPGAALKGLKQKRKESASFVLAGTNANGTGTVSATLARLRGVR